MKIKCTFVEITCGDHAIRGLITDDVVYVFEGYWRPLIIYFFGY